MCACKRKHLQKTQIELTSLIITLPVEKSLNNLLFLLLFICYEKIIIQCHISFITEYSDYHKGENNNSNLQFLNNLKKVLNIFTVKYFKM